MTPASDALRHSLSRGRKQSLPGLTGWGLERLELFGTTGTNEFRDGLLSSWLLGAPDSKIRLSYSLSSSNISQGCTLISLPSVSLARPAPIRMKNTFAAGTHIRHAFAANPAGQQQAALDGQLP